MSHRPVLFVVAICALAPTLARAEVRTIASRGLWFAFEGTGEDQRQVCGIATGSAEARRISIAQSAGETGLSIAFEKAGWTIPDGTPIQVTVQISGRSLPGLDGVGAGPRINAAMPFAPSIDFMRALRHGTEIRVNFPSGNEPFWSGGLSGSSAAIDAFNACRGRIMGAATQPPAPAAPAPTPQTPAVATQPFTPSAAPYPAPIAPSPPSVPAPLPPIPPAPATTSAP